MGIPIQTRADRHGDRGGGGENSSGEDCTSESAPGFTTVIATREAARHAGAGLYAASRLQAASRRACATDPRAITPLLGAAWEPVPCTPRASAWLPPGRGDLPSIHLGEWRWPGSRMLHRRSSRGSCFIRFVPFAAHVRTTSSSGVLPSMPVFCGTVALCPATQRSHVESPSRELVSRGAWCAEWHDGSATRRS